MYFPIGSNENFLIYTDKGEYHLLEFNSPPDNRFTPEFCPAFIEALTWIQNECEPKPLVTTSTSAKFYSNGLDFERAIASPTFFDECYYPMMRVMLEFPWPTVALVNGHAFAAGFMIAACHDYIVMNPHKGFLCMNELQFGAPLLPPMMGIFRVKYGTLRAHEIGLTAHRYTGKEAFELGMVTKLGGIAEAEEIVSQVAKFARMPSYGAIRKELYREVIAYTWTHYESQKEMEANVARETEYYDAIIDSYRSKSKL